MKRVFVFTIKVLIVLLLMMLVGIIPEIGIPAAIIAGYIGVKLVRQNKKEKED